MTTELYINIEGLLRVDDWKDGTNPIPPQQIALDKLVAEAVSPDMLEDEPLAEALLTRFRERLFLSLQHVDKALAFVRNTKA